MEIPFDTNMEPICYSVDAVPSACFLNGAEGQGIQGEGRPPGPAPPTDPVLPSQSFHCDISAVSPTCHNNQLSKMEKIGQMGLAKSSGTTQWVVPTSAGFASRPPALIAKKEMTNSLSPAPHGQTPMDSNCLPVETQNSREGQDNPEGQDSQQAQVPRAGPARAPAPTEGKVSKTYRDALVYNLTKPEPCRVRSLNIASSFVEPQVDLTLSREEEEFWDRETTEGQDTRESRDRKAKRGSGKEEPRLDKRARTGEAKPWLSARTLRKLQEAILFDEEECSVCAIRLPLKRLKVHVRQHYIHNYCKCGERKHSRDSMLDHIKKYTGQPSHSTEVIECDQENFLALREHMGWDDSTTFPECRPTLLGPGRTLEADTRLKIDARRKERRERVADRLGSQRPRITTSPPANRQAASPAPVIRVRRLALPEEPTTSRSKVQTQPLEEPTDVLTTAQTQENEWMWSCLSAAASLEAEADQLADKVAALRRKANTFRELSKKWRQAPQTDQ